MNKILFYFTRGFSSGITLLRTYVRGLLPNLYVINENPSNDSSTLVYDGDYPNIYPHSYGQYLDLLGDMFGLTRNNNEEDLEFRRRILFSIGQSPTKDGIKNSIERLFSTYGILANVTIRENYSNAFDGTSSTFDVPIRDPSGSLLYGISVIIEPIRYNAVRKVLDADGLIVDTVLNVFNFDTFQIESKSVDSWYRYKSPYVDRLIEAFRVPSFRFLIDDISAAGVRVDRVIIKEPGAGGSKGEIYDS